MKTRDIVIFFAGFEFFHTLSHIILPFVIKLPLVTEMFTLTPRMNAWTIGVNAVITLLLLWWASRLKSQKFLFR